MPTPNGSTTLALEIAPDIDSITAARIRYAFQVFAAVYGYGFCQNESDSVEGLTVIRYGSGSANSLPARYQARNPSVPAPKPTMHFVSGIELPIFHGIDSRTKVPDFLAEIFEWISHAHEYSVGPDAIERPNQKEFLWSKYDLDATQPYAAILMAWFHDHISKRAFAGQADVASKIEGIEHAIVCSHDVDYYAAGLRSALRRQMQNVIVGAYRFKSASYTAANIQAIMRTLLGQKVAKFIPDYIERSRGQNYSSTFFVIPRHRLRRDANYKLSSFGNDLLDLRQSGYEVALHGSYDSIVGRDDLSADADRLAKVVRDTIRGGRQHYLRFDTHEKLYRNIEDAKFEYDSTLGFTDRIGFRGAACFPYPPYDFSNERPCSFLEFPLTVMDGALSGNLASARTQVFRVLENSKRWGWGGISILWHNPVDPVHVRPRINDLYWELLESRNQRKESWMSAVSLYEKIAPRYNAAGLLKASPANLEQGSVRA